MRMSHRFPARQPVDVSEVAEPLWSEPSPDGSASSGDDAVHKMHSQRQIMGGSCMFNNQFSSVNYRAL